MLSKKGQMALFIIAGIILIAGVVFGILFFAQSPDIASIKSPQGNEVVVFVRDCLEKTAEESLLFVSLSGGYYSMPELYTDSFQITVPYYYYEGEPHVPGLDVFSASISDAIEAHLSDCLDFSRIQAVDVNQKGEPQVTTIIGERSIIVNLDYPLDIIDEGKTSTLREFRVELPVPLKEKFVQIGKFIEIQEIDPNEVMLAQLMELAHQNGFKFGLSFDDDNVLYAFTFGDVSVLEKPLAIYFAVKYDWRV